MIEFIAGCVAGVAIAKKVQAIAEFEIPKLPPKVRIVKMTADKYAVRKGYLWSDNYSFWGRDSSWWTGDEYINKYCLHSLEECKDMMASIALTDGEPIDG